MSELPGSVVALITRLGDGKVLSVTRRNKPNDLCLAGGSIEPTDLSPRHALIREVLEETGVEVVSAKWVMSRVDETDGRDVWYYEVMSWTGEPRVMEPGIDVSWRNPTELITPECTFAEHNKALFSQLGLIITLTFPMPPPT